MNEEQQTVEITNNSALDSFVTVDDIPILFGNLVLITVIAFLVGRIIVFVPDFMVSLIRKVKNKSIIYSNDTVDDPKLDPSLDKSELGFKNLLDRWVKW